MLNSRCTKYRSVHYWERMLGSPTVQICWFHTGGYPMQKTRDIQRKLSTIHNWRTTDEDEIARRRYRAQTESLRVRNLDPRFPIFSNFAVKSESGLTYAVEIRSISQRRFSCNCVDFRINALGTCKHVEATLLYLEARYGRLFSRAQKNGNGRLDVVPDIASGALRIEGGNGSLPTALAGMVDGDGILRTEDPEEAVAKLRHAGIPSLRISQEVAPWLEARRREQERKFALREYEQKVQSGEWPCAGNAGAPISISARRHAAPGFQRAGFAGR